LEAFSSWYSAGQETSEAVSQAYAVFGAPGHPSFAPELQLARSRALGTVLPDVRDPARKRAWTELRQVVEELRGGGVELNPLLGQICAHLAEESLEQALSPDTPTEQRDQFLAETEALTLIEKRVLKDVACAAEFRLGRIEQVRSRSPSVDIAVALRSVGKDPSQSYAPAFVALADAWQRGTSANEAERVTIEKALLGYRGDDASLLAIRSVLATRREAEAARIAAEAQQRELAAQMRPPCQECGTRTHKNDRICPGCGSSFGP
jgi:hypothetical protein